MHHSLLYEIEKLSCFSVDYESDCKHNMTKDQTSNRLVRDARKWGKINVTLRYALCAYVIKAMKEK